MSFPLLLLEAIPFSFTHTNVQNLFLIYRTNIEKASPSKNPANNTIGGSFVSAELKTNS
jgi:hypothetical protein